MVMVGARPAKACCDGEIILPFGARSWCNVLAAASNLMPAPRGSHGAGASVLAVSENVAQHSSLLCVRAVPRSLWPLLFLSKGKGAALARRLFLLSERARYGVSAAASSAKPESCHAARARKRSLSLGRTGAALELASRARRAAIVVEAQAS